MSLPASPHFLWLLQERVHNFLTADELINARLCCKSWRSAIEARKPSPKSPPWWIRESLCETTLALGSSDVDPNWHHAMLWRLLHERQALRALEPRWLLECHYFQNVRDDVDEYDYPHGLHYSPSMNEVASDFDIISDNFRFALLAVLPHLSSIRCAASSACTLRFRHVAALRRRDGPPGLACFRLSALLKQKVKFELGEELGGNGACIAFAASGFAPVLTVTKTKLILTLHSRVFSSGGNARFASLPSQQLLYRNWDRRDLFRDHNEKPLNVRVVELKDKTREAAAGIAAILRPLVILWSTFGPDGPSYFGHSPHCFESTHSAFLHKDISQAFKFIPKQTRMCSNSFLRIALHLTDLRQYPPKRRPAFPCHESCVAIAELIETVSVKRSEHAKQVRRGLFSCLRRRNAHQRKLLRRFAQARLPFEFKYADKKQHDRFEKALAGRQVAALIGCFVERLRTMHGTQWNRADIVKYVRQVCKERELEMFSLEPLPECTRYCVLSEVAAQIADDMAVSLYTTKPVTYRRPLEDKHGAEQRPVGDVNFFDWPFRFVQEFESFAKLHFDEVTFSNDDLLRAIANNDTDLESLPLLARACDEAYI
ncbi:MAG: hypothetical protein MHM6MM_002939 [Cercozoa sp. M6MM]